MSKGGAELRLPALDSFQMVCSSFCCCLFVLGFVLFFTR